MDLWDGMEGDEADAKFRKGHKSYDVDMVKLMRGPVCVLLLFVAGLIFLLVRSS